MDGLMKWLSNNGVNIDLDYRKNFFDWLKEAVMLTSVFTILLLIFMLMALMPRDTLISVLNVFLNPKYFIYVLAFTLVYMVFIVLVKIFLQFANFKLASLRAVKTK